MRWLVLYKAANRLNSVFPVLTHTRPQRLFCWQLFQHFTSSYPHICVHNPSGVLHFISEGLYYHTGFLLYNPAAPERQTCAGSQQTSWEAMQSWHLHLISDFQQERQHASHLSESNVFSGVKVNRNRALFFNLLLQLSFPHYYQQHLSFFFFFLLPLGGERKSGNLFNCIPGFRGANQYKHTEPTVVVFILGLGRSRSPWCPSSHSSAGWSCSPSPSAAPGLYWPVGIYHITAFEVTNIYLSNQAQKNILNFKENEVGCLHALFRYKVPSSKGYSQSNTF